MVPRKLMTSRRQIKVKDKSGKRINFIDIDIIVLTANVNPNKLILETSITLW